MYMSQTSLINFLNMSGCILTINSGFFMDQRWENFKDYHLDPMECITSNKLVNYQWSDPAKIGNK